MAAFTSETKYGYFDGQHIGNWSSLFPLFARVVNGQLYMVGREDNPNGDTSRFGKMFYVSRAWMKGAVFNGNPSDADLFTDKPNQVEDPSLPGSMFNKTADTSQVITRPDINATGTGGTTQPTPTTTTDPVKTDTTKTDTTKTTTQTSVGTSLTSGTTAAVTTTTSKLSNTTLILIAVAAVGAIAAVIYFMKKKK